MKNNLTSGWLLFLFVCTAQLFSSCSGPKVAYLPKGTGSFKDSYQTKINTQTASARTSNANTAGSIAENKLPELFPQVNLVENPAENRQQISFKQPSRRELKKLHQRLEAVLDTTKKRDRVTIKTNEKKVDELRNEVENLKKSVKAEKSGDKVVVSFDKPQTGLSTGAKVLVIVVAALLLVALLSLPIIGPVLGIVLGIAVVAAALALVLGIVEIG